MWNCSCNSDSCMWHKLFHSLPGGGDLWWSCPHFSSSLIWTGKWLVSIDHQSPGYHSVIPKLATWWHHSKDIANLMFPRDISQRVQQVKKHEPLSMLHLLMNLLSDTRHMGPNAVTLSPYFICDSIHSQYFNICNIWQIIRLRKPFSFFSY